MRGEMSVALMGISGLLDVYIMRIEFHIFDE